MTILESLHSSWRGNILCECITSLRTIFPFLVTTSRLMSSSYVVNNSTIVFFEGTVLFSDMQGVSRIWIYRSAYMMYSFSNSPGKWVRLLGYYCFSVNTPHNNNLNNYLHKNSNCNKLTSIIKQLDSVSNSAWLDDIDGIAMYIFSKRIYTERLK